MASSFFDPTPLIGLMQADLPDRAALDLFTHIQDLFDRGAGHMGRPSDAVIARLFSSLASSPAALSCPAGAARARSACMGCWSPWEEEGGWGWAGMVSSLKQCGPTEGLEELLAHPGAPSAEALSGPAPGGVGPALQIIMDQESKVGGASLVRTLQVLLNAGVNPNTPFPGGNTALGQTLNPAVASLLLSKGGQLKIRSLDFSAPALRLAAQLDKRLLVWEGLHRQASHEKMLKVAFKEAMPTITEALAHVLRAPPLSSNRSEAVDGGRLIAQWRAFGRRVGHDMFRPPVGTPSLQGAWARASVRRFLAGTDFHPVRETSLTQDLNLPPPALPDAWGGVDETGVPWAVWGVLRHLMDGQMDASGRVRFPPEPHLKPFGTGLEFWPLLMEVMDGFDRSRPGAAFLLNRLRTCVFDFEPWFIQAQRMLFCCVDRAKESTVGFSKLHWSCLNDLATQLQLRLESTPVDAPGWGQNAQTILEYQMLDGLHQPVRFKRLMELGADRIDRVGLLALAKRTREGFKVTSPEQQGVLFSLALPPVDVRSSSRPRL